MRMTYARQLLFYLLISFFLFPDLAQAEDFLLPQPQTLVNDSAHLLEASEIRRLERMLRSYWDSTSRQIFVVTVRDYKGYDAAGFATELGNQWKAGKAGVDNGIIVLLRPSAMPPLEPETEREVYDSQFELLFDRILSSTESKAGVGKELFEAMQVFSDDSKYAYENRPAGDYGGAYIAVGYGLEPVVPDAIAYTIVIRYMRPFIVAHRYAEALEAASYAIITAASGDMSTVGEPLRNGQTNGEEDFSLWWLLLPSAIIFFVAAYKTKKSDKKQFWLWTFLGLFFYLHLRLLILVIASSGRRSSSSSDGDGFSGGEGGSFGGGGGGAEF